MVFFLLVFRFQKGKIHFELLKKVLEQEIFVDLTLNFVWQLVENLLVLLGCYRVVFVILPEILEVLLKFCNHFNWERLIFVKMLEQKNPAWHIFAFFVLSCDRLHHEQDLDQLWHDIGEASDSNDQNEGHNDTLNFALRVEISETNRGHRREHEIRNNRSVFHGGQFTHPVHIVERVIISVARSELSHDEPHSAEQVSQEQDEYDQAEDLEAFEEYNLLHNLVVIELSIVDIRALAFDQLDHFISVVITNNRREVLHIKHRCDIGHAEEAQQVDEVSFIRCHRIFKICMKGPGGASYQVVEEVSKDVVLGNFEMISDRFVRVRWIPILDKEAFNDFEDKDDLHEVVHDNDGKFLRAPEAWEKGRKYSGYCWTDNN